MVCTDIFQAVIETLFRDYAVAKETQKIQRREAKQRKGQTEEMIKSVANRFIDLMIKQRDNSQAMLDKVYSIRVISCVTYDDISAFL